MIRLDIGLGVSPSADVSPLASLQCLQELAIDSGKSLMGLQAVLTSCPLMCLKLHCEEVVEEGLGPLQSPSLQELWLTYLSGGKLSSPTVLACGVNLPAESVLAWCVHLEKHASAGAAVC